MKLLIAYDGSRFADLALDDLLRAGLPEKCDAEVISVAEVWLPPADSANGDVSTDPYILSIVERRREKGEKALTEYEAYAHHAETRLKSMFPGWSVSALAAFGSPAWEIVARGEKTKPDLIVTGSQGQSAISRFILGSISQKVLNESKCSVRVARGKIDVDPSPVRLVVGFDGTRGARAAVDAVIARNWPEDTEVRLVSVTDPVSPSPIGRFVPPISNAVDEVNKSELEWIQAQGANAVRDLESIGVAAFHKVVHGSPKKMIVEEAESWNADSIFVGANAYGSKLERFLLGSVSSAVAARAHCTVEVVR